MESIKVLKTLNQVEKETILEAIEFHNGDLKAAAESLGIHRSLIYRKMKRLNIVVNKKVYRELGDIYGRD